MLQNLLMLAGCIPMLVLIAFVFFDRWRRKRVGEKPPQQDRLLRPAGHTLWLRLEELNDYFATWMIGSCLSSLIAFGVIASYGLGGGTIWVILFLVLGFGAAGCTVGAWRILKEIRLNRLGLRGEQAVAEHLQALLAEGFCVFHDVPGDGKWNIDHVVVGPSGVFAIETKARTKQPGRAGTRTYEAVFDGRAIRFPRYTDAASPEQAQRNARWLADMLTKATGERVPVRPIVALPGWWVTLNANSDVKVLSGKQVPAFISKEPATLSDKAAQQISYQLDQRCRDVEFY